MTAHPRVHSTFDQLLSYPLVMPDPADGSGRSSQRLKRHFKAQEVTISRYLECALAPWR
jgi:hypothetical protein